MSSITLWIQLEDKPSPRKYKVDLRKIELHTPDLCCLAALICKDIDIKALSKTHVSSLEFFFGDDRINPIPVGFPLQTLAEKNNCRNPLVICYPLSNCRVHVCYNLSTSKGSITLPHTTGIWYLLRQAVYKKFNMLQEGDPKFSFIQNLDDEEGEYHVTNGFELNALVKQASVMGRNREISLRIKIKGKKAYEEYTLNEVSDIFAKDKYIDEWKNIGNMSLFNIDSLPNSALEITETQYQKFVSQLEDNYISFGRQISSEGTAREIISTFMTTAVRLIYDYLKDKNHDFKDGDLRLLVDEYLSGSRGYGLVDYIVKYLQFEVIVSKAKHEDINQGVAQTIVQMYSALENLNKKRKHSQTGVSFSMYGIVATARTWRFLRWTGSLKNPIIQLSAAKHTGDFDGAKEQSKWILRIIIRVLLSAIGVLNEPIEHDKAENKDDSKEKEILTKRSRY